MTEMLRVGVFGAGVISRAHVAGYKSVGGRAEVTAIADANETAALGLRGALGKDAEIYGDWRALIDKADVDAVDICLPHHMHAPAAVAAAETGRHILVEKPIARNLREADEMISAAEKAGVKLMVLHDRRYEPVWARIQEVLREGVLGRLITLRLDHNQSVDVPQGHWIFARELLGGGAIMSCLTHQIDLIRWYGGEVTEVGCLSVTIPERMEGEIAGVVTMRLSSGAVAEASINWHVRGRGLRGWPWYEFAWITGTRGNLHNFGGLHLLRDDEIDRGYQTLPTEGGAGHATAVAHFVDCVLEDREPLTNGRDGRAALEVALAAYASQKTGRFVTLPLDGDAAQTDFEASRTSEGPVI